MTHTRPEPTLAEQFARWLDTTDPTAPATRVYFTGFLSPVRGTVRYDDLDRRHQVLAATDPEAKAVADLAFTAAEAGRVVLTQRRLGDGCWEYLATRSRLRHQGDRYR